MTFLEISLLTHSNSLWNGSIASTAVILKHSTQCLSNVKATF